jgi:hypothetical protein
MRACILTGLHGNFSQFQSVRALAYSRSQGWLGIFSIGYKPIEATVATAGSAAAGSAAGAAAEAAAGAAADAPPALAPAIVSAAAAASPPVGDMLLHCERYWQTAGSGVEKGAVVNSLAVVTTAAHALSQLGSSSSTGGSIASLTRTLRAGAGFDVVAAAAAVASTASSASASGPDSMVTADDDGSSAADTIQARVEAVVSGVVTVLDYGSVLTVWRKT